MQYAETNFHSFLFWEKQSDSHRACYFFNHEWNIVHALVIFIRTGQWICRRNGRHLHPAIMSVCRIVSAVFCGQSTADVLFSEKVVKADQYTIETGCISCADEKKVWQSLRRKTARYICLC